MIVTGNWDSFLEVGRIQEIGTISGTGPFHEVGRIE